MTKDGSMDRELYGVQMLRGIAALMVVLHHTLEESMASVAGSRSPDWLTTAGASGVDVFFAVSGFIMLYVSFPPNRRPLGPRQFLVKRATRIYPFYWACCLAILVICGTGFLKSKILSADVLLESFALWPTPDTLIGVSWTLSYEIYFYLAFALSLFWRNQYASLAVTTTIITFLLVASQPVASGASSNFLANPIVLEFCFGAILAGIYMSLPKRPLVPAYWSLLGFVVLIVAPAFVMHPNTNGLTGMSRVLFWGLPAVLILAGFISIGAPRNPLARFAVLSGDASYAIYLTHGFVMIAYAKLLKSSSLSLYTQLPVIPMIVGICIIVGLATHLFLERPLLALTRGLMSRKSDSRGAKAAASPLPGGADTTRLN